LELKKNWEQRKLRAEENSELQKIGARTKNRYENKSGAKPKKINLEKNPELELKIDLEKNLELELEWSSINTLQRAFLEKLDSTMLACGRNSSAVLSPDGSLYTTGGNRCGQIGHGMATSKWVFEKPKYEENLHFVFVDIFVHRCH
jgi:alpha-tubulin suppressor-like RCC1 family protein